MKIFVVCGARPNFIKIAPLMREMARYPDEIEPVLVHTGQHYDFSLSKIFFEELGLPRPDYSLGAGSGQHAEQTARIMVKLEKLFLAEKPDLVMVVGDVNSTLAAALVAAKLNIKLAHIEAGLRSFNKSMPEEINRVLTDKISDYLFCPTETAVANLRNEGITRGVYKVGDIMYEMFLKAIRIAKTKSGLVKKLGLKRKQYLLATVHRAESTDNPEHLRGIMAALLEVDEKIVLPVHPRTQKALRRIKFKNTNKNLMMIDPVGYYEMLALERDARMILTDSGGVQKEAYFLKVPCVTLRKETEWIETLNGGWNILAGPDKEKILSGISRTPPLSKQNRYYGNGAVSKKIIKVVREQ